MPEREEPGREDASPRRPGYHARPPGGRLLSSRALWLYVLAAAGAVAGVGGRDVLLALFEKAPPASSVRVQVQLPAVPGAPGGPADTVVRQQALVRVEPWLQWADAQTRQAADAHLSAVDGFFNEAKARTPRFSKRVLGWGSKWRLAADKMPFTRDDRHARFLATAFNEQLFSPEQLTQAIDQAVRNYTASVTGIENQMLVRMRADVGDLPAAVLPEFVDEAQLRVAFEQAMAETTARVGTELRADVSREAVSVIVGEVLTLVAVRLGVSGGILAAGAGSSWATFGIGLVVGLIIDQAVSWVWDWWRDPEGEIARKMAGKLDEIRALIVEGDGNTPGLRPRLAELAEKRSQLRRQALKEMIQPEGVQ